MIQKKVCMLGAFAVGKTSLVRRYVHSIFSDRYHTTVGVKIDRKVLSVDDQDITMLLWDMVGKDDYTQIATGQLRGAAGYLLVIDPTRPATLDVATWIHRTIAETHEGLPFVVALNKHDIADRWALTDAQLAQLDDLRAKGWRILKTSARSGEGVDEMFSTLAEDLLE